MAELDLESTENKINENKSKEAKFKVRLIILSVIIALIVILSLIKRIEWVAEYIFARGISRAYAFVIGNITSIFPFSIFEFLIYAAIVAAIAFIVIVIRCLVKKKWIKLGSTSLNAAIIVVSVVLVYIITASINYCREPVVLEAYEESVNSEEYLSIGEYFLNDYNSLAESLERDSNNNLINPYTDRELAKILREEYKRIQSPYFNSFVPLAKPILFSKFLSINYLMGISFAPTAEPNINKDMPCFEKPFTMAHEIAHSIGIMREEEANLLASYITLTSDNDFVRYSGYYSTFGQISSIVACSSAEDYMAFRNNYSTLIFTDSDFRWEFWGNQNSFMDDISTFFNNLYLKLQGVEDGVESYGNSYDYEVVDTGETNNEGQPIFEIEFSEVQKIYLSIYYDNINS